MFRFLSTVARVCLSTGLGAGLGADLFAQATLQDLQRQLQQEAQALANKSPTDEQRRELHGQQIVRLRQFVAEQAKGDDRWNARLMLADFQLAGGDRTAAAKALREIDAAAAPALLLITAATMAQHLNLGDERMQWINTAVAKPAPLDDRLAMARLLQLVLHEVELGEKILSDALAEAADNEQRAYVRWHRADVMRDREDLPENAGFEQFDLLAKELPSTYWGSVARDRVRATELRPGDEAIPFSARTRDGADFALAGLGKAVVLAFYSVADYDTPTLVGKLRELQNNHKRQLAVIGICLDEDEAAITAQIKALGIDFPVIADGKGTRQDVALRWGVEGPAVHVIDTKGRIVALGLHVGTADARAELDEFVKRATS